MVWEFHLVRVEFRLFYFLSAAADLNLELPKIKLVVRVELELGDSRLQVQGSNYSATSRYLGSFLCQVNVTVMYYKSVQIQRCHYGKNTFKIRCTLQYGEYLFTDVPSLAYYSFILLFNRGGENEALSESHQAFEVAAAPTSGQVTLFPSRQSRFTSTRNAELAIPRVRGYCSLVLKLYPSNMQRMLSKDLTRLDAGRVFSSAPKSNKRKKASGWICKDFPTNLYHPAIHP